MGIRIRNASTRMISHAAGGGQSLKQRNPKRDQVWLALHTRLDVATDLAHDHLRLLSLELDLACGQRRNSLSRDNSKAQVGTFNERPHPRERRVWTRFGAHKDPWPRRGAACRADLAVQLAHRDLRVRESPPLGDETPPRFRSRAKEKTQARDAFARASPMSRDARAPA